MQNTDESEILGTIMLVAVAVFTSFLVTSAYYEYNPVIKEIPTISPTIFKVKVIDEIGMCNREKGNIYTETNLTTGDYGETKTYGSIRCEKEYKEGNKTIKETLFDYNF